MSNVLKQVVLPPETSISESEPALINVIDSIPALIAYIDCNMILQYCNRSFRTWFAVQSSVAGKSFPVVVGKQIFNQVQRHMGKVLVGSRAHFELSIPTLNGMQWLDVSLSPDFDHRHRVKGFVFHGSDITEKNKVERTLKDYFENASIGLHWVNADGIIVWANPAELNMLGYTEQEYIGHPISEFHADQNVIQDILGRLWDKQILSNYEADMLTKDGSIRHVSINSNVLWEGDQFIHTRCFTVDITQQKRALKALKESEERFRMMANMVPLILWTTDQRGACNFLSERWEEVTGQPISTGLGNQWMSFIHSDDQENINRSWLTSFTDRRTFEAKFRFLSSAGTYHVTYANACPRYTDAGEFDGYIGILQDISAEEKIKSSLEKIVLERTKDLRNRNAALKEAEHKLVEKNAALEKINQQLSSFAHIASHDLQEPLRKVQTFATRVLETEADKLSDKGRDMMRRVSESSNRMRDLVRHILASSETSTPTSKDEYVDLNVVFDDVVNELEIKIADKKARVENLGLPKLSAVKFQFHQLFLNLIGNSLKFSKKDGEPHLVVRSDIVRGEEVDPSVGLGQGPYHHISVSDNGIGFEPAFSEKIFDKFQRLKNENQYEGSGLGLAICKKIVEDHNGRIIAEGRVNIGATFHIYLPADN